MGSEEEPSQARRALVDALAGAISGGISRTVTSPLDVIKIRFQVQLEPTTSWGVLRRDVYGPSKYTGLLQATKDILREEGFPGFWRGNVPALLMYMPYTAIQFTVLHKLKTFASGSSRTDDHLHLSPYLSYVSGAIAGCAATVGSYPFDLLRTILASQGEPKIPGHCLLTLGASHMDLTIDIRSIILESVIYPAVEHSVSVSTFNKHMYTWPIPVVLSTVYKNYAVSTKLFWQQFKAEVYPNMRSAFVDIIKTRGVQGLYAGLTPTLVEIIPYAGLQFGSYDTFKRTMMAWNRYRYSHLNSGSEDDSVSSLQLFISGFLAGTFSKAACHPLDVVKKRFQIEGLKRHPRYGARIESSTYKGMYHALKEIVTKEGFGGLYKGLFPSLVKSAPAGAVTFLAYEHISDWIANKAGVE